MAESSAAEDASIGVKDISPSLSVPAKRGPGRPKGSCNKKQRVHSEELPSEPKPPGVDPRGSGPKQQARAQGIVEPELPRRPVGRPPKLSPPTSLSIRLGCDRSNRFSAGSRC
ncbi:hypothetical protein R3P38DRAFT_2795127 [Favolaschia claudopus]|uniref:Uncharacterized protein n=1 Tax=Favolaschia claudopus TaxID=2862362 RepID=A0AAW0A7T4_9AGAR